MKVIFILSKPVIKTLSATVFTYDNGTQIGWSKALSSSTAVTAPRLCRPGGHPWSLSCRADLCTVGPPLCPPDTRSTVTLYRVVTLPSCPSQRALSQGKGPVYWWHGKRGILYKTIGATGIGIRVQTDKTSQWGTWHTECPVSVRASTFSQWSVKDIYSTTKIQQVEIAEWRLKVLTCFKFGEPFKKP